MAHNKMVKGMQMKYQHKCRIRFLQNFQFTDSNQYILEGICFKYFKTDFHVLTTLMIFIKCVISIYFSLLHVPFMLITF